MKSEKEIRQVMAFIQDNLGTSDHPGEKNAQGFLSALRWVVGDKEFHTLSKLANGEIPKYARLEQTEKS